MSELQSLYLIFALFYLAECLVWVRSRGVLFFSPWGRTWRFKEPDQLFGNQNGGFWFGNPLPDLGYLQQGFFLPVCLTPTTLSTVDVHTGQLPAETVRRVSLDAIETVQRDGLSLIINQDFKIRAGNEHCARQLFRFLQDFRKVPEGERLAALEAFYQGRFHTGTIEERLADLRRHGLPLRILANLLWFFLFLITPALTLLMPLETLLFPWLTAYAVLHLATLGTFWIAYRRLHEGAAREGLYGALFKILFFTPGLIRAGDLLALPLLTTYHPLAIALAVDPQQSSTGFARRYLLRLKFPLGEDRWDAESREEAQWFRAWLLARCEALLTQKGLAPARLLLPDNLDEGSLSYCPRCLTAYQVVRGECAECPGIQLVQPQHQGERS
ncbi:MAG TPA: hypothetical protein PKV71_10270 [Calditrichia bacterium]|nr:hypothetical protein [Calditrichota bacterium]HQV32252.1 hypothetical protein [Calditrichia bacterium]